VRDIQNKRLKREAHHERLLISEVLDVETRQLVVSLNISDYVMSNEIVSAILAQVPQPTTTPEYLSPPHFHIAIQKTKPKKEERRKVNLWRKNMKGPWASTPALCASSSTTMLLPWVFLLSAFCISLILPPFSAFVRCMHPFPQIAECRDMNPVVNELLREEGAEFHLRPVRKYAWEGDELCFWDIMARARVLGEVSFKRRRRRRRGGGRGRGRRRRRRKEREQDKQEEEREEQEREE
jgi:hypothetical protein